MQAIAVIDAEVLADHAAHGNAAEMHSRELQRIKQADHVARHVGKREPAGWCAAFAVTPGIVAKHPIAGGQQDRYLVVPQAPVGGETMAQRDDGRVREPDQFIDHLKVAKINPHGASPSNRSPGRREI